MLQPLTTTKLASLCLQASCVPKHHEYFTKHRYLSRSYEGDRFSKSSRASFHFNFDVQIGRVETRCLHHHHQHIVPQNAAHISDDTNQQHNDFSKATLIWRAIKLPIYSVALVPLTVGGAAAYLQTGLFSARRYIVLLVSSVLIITWLNLSNDVYDFDTGADKNKKESVLNLFGSRSGPLIAAYLSLDLGFTGLCWVAIDAGSMSSLFLLVCAIFCGYVYQCPPFRLSYQGLGEPLCFAAFGPFATTAFYLLLCSTSGKIFLPLTHTVLSASVLVGLTTSLILFCSHFHQVEEDIAVGKMSPLVLCALTLPIGKLVVNFVEENHKDKGKIFMAKYYCVRLHALFGAAMATGLVSARILVK